MRCIMREHYSKEYRELLARKFRNASRWWFLGWTNKETDTLFFAPRDHQSGVDLDGVLRAEAKA